MVVTRAAPERKVPNWLQRMSVEKQDMILKISILTICCILCECLNNSAYF